MTKICEGIFTITHIQRNYTSFMMNTEDGREWKLEHQDFLKLKNVLACPTNLAHHLRPRESSDVANLFALGHRVQVIYDTVLKQHDILDLQRPSSRKIKIPCSVSANVLFTDGGTGALPIHGTITRTIPVQNNGIFLQVARHNLSGFDVRVMACFLVTIGAIVVSWKSRLW